MNRPIHVAIRRQCLSSVADRCLREKSFKVGSDGGEPILSGALAQSAGGPAQNLYRGHPGATSQDRCGLLRSLAAFRQPGCRESEPCLASRGRQRWCRRERRKDGASLPTLHGRECCCDSRRGALSGRGHDHRQWAAPPVGSGVGTALPARQKAITFTISTEVGQPGKAVAVERMLSGEKEQGRARGRRRLALYDSTEPSVSGWLARKAVLRNSVALVRPRDRHDPDRKARQTIACGSYAALSRGHSSRISCGVQAQAGGRRHCAADGRLALLACVSLEVRAVVERAACLAAWRRLRKMPPFPRPALARLSDTAPAARAIAAFRACRCRDEDGR